jgi:predicted phage baseplate assembly protein
MLARGPAVGGADAEDLGHVAGRAVETLWAHERLIDVTSAKGSTSLAGLDRAVAVSSRAPWRATTALDFERLAFDVPGTRVARARAWPGVDPACPGQWVAGTVTVVVVPELPRGRPQPSPGLLRAVRRYLDRRRVVCTRVVVVGPRYLKLGVRCTLAPAPSVHPERLIADVRAALDGYLDPLVGGADGHGWPFGRGIHRAELLHVVASVHGVDHVAELELISQENDGQVLCGNVCLAPTWLVTPGVHTILVQ